MSEVNYNLIVLRYGELFLKGCNRGQFEKILVDNVKRCLNDLSIISIERGQGRLFIKAAPQDLPIALKRVAQVFGLSSVSPAIDVEPDLEKMQSIALVLTQHLLAGRPYRSFRVTARRGDKRFPLSSPDLNREIGATIFMTTNLPVDLHNPELEIGVEIGAVRSFIYAEHIPGAGGLPVGVSGKINLLLSGGIDSPVAGHLLQKRGCTLQATYFHSPPYTSARAQDKVQKLAAKLAPAQGELALHVVHFTDIQEAIRNLYRDDLNVVLYRRMMMRIACRLAEQGHCAALATGENLGQVASQTLANMAAIEDVAELPVLRPLLAFDKTETIALARRIGTYELSTLPFEDCCSLFVPKHPSTKARLELLTRAEEKLEVNALIEAALSRTEVIAIAPQY